MMAVAHRRSGLPEVDHERYAGSERTMHLPPRTVPHRSNAVTLIVVLFSGLDVEDLFFHWQVLVILIVCDPATVPVVTAGCQIAGHHETRRAWMF